MRKKGSGRDDLCNLISSFKLIRFSLTILMLFASWSPGESFDRSLDDSRDTRCKTIRPYRNCVLIPMILTDDFFDLPVGTLVEWGCFPSSDMESVCGDFGLCPRTKKYAVRGGFD